MNRYVAMAVAVVAAVLVARVDTHDGRCESMYLRYGLETMTCPSGTIRQTARIQIYDMRRGAPASVRIGAQAHFTIAEADEVQTLDVPEIQNARRPRSSATSRTYSTATRRRRSSRVVRSTASSPRSCA